MVKRLRKKPACNLARQSLMSDVLEHAVVFDLETTGFSSAHDEIIQLGAIRVWKGQVMHDDVFVEHLHTTRILPELVSQMTGIQEHHLRGAPKQWLVLHSFAHFVGDSVLIGHNAHSFDRRFLEALLDREKRQYAGTRTVEYVDSLAYARAIYGNVRGSSLSLDSLCDGHGITSDRPRHTALGDADRLAQVVIRLSEQLGDRWGTQADVRRMRLPSMALSAF